MSDKKERFDFSKFADELELDNKKAGSAQTRFIDYQGGNEEEKRIQSEKAILDYFQQSMVSNLTRVKTIEDLEKELERGIVSPMTLRGISRELHSIDPNYLKIISYFKDMFHTRYIVIPTTENADDEINPEDYQNLMGIVDGIALETLVPQILEALYIDGIVGVYFDFDESSSALLGTILPASRVRSSFQTMFGTHVVEFDFAFFDGYARDQVDEVLSTFPEEFAAKYNEVKDKQSKWAILDPTRAAAIKMNSLATPPFISALAGILEFKKTRENELEKGANELKKLLINEIPLDNNGNPIFDLKEIRDLTRAMRSVIKNRDVDIVTAFGKTSMHSLQEEGRAENKRITQAFSTIYSASGVNPAIFSGLTDGAIEASREADKSFVWNAYKEIELILNLVVSNLLPSSNLQARFQFLPITMHGESEAVKIYREGAAFGIGKLDAIVAAGIRQSDITRRSKLEAFLDLENILIPLQSSHTTSGKDILESKEKVEETEVVENENEVNENEQG